MANRRFTQFFNTLHNRPVLLDCNFVVDPTNSAGITSLKGPGIQNVFMHTSTTPVAGNPNPANGYAIVQLQDNYNYFYSMFYNVEAPLSGSSLTAVTANVAYTITILGTATLAQWQAKGLPIGITPAIGASFVATAAGTIGGSAAVQVSSSSGIVGVEVIGNPNKTIVSSAATVPGLSSGAYLMLRFMGASFAGSALATHTHDFTVIGGQAASTTNNIANYAGPIIGKQEATNATYLGSASATNGGVVAASAGTPAGSVSLAAVAPASGSLVSLGIYLSNSSVIVKGE